MCLSFFLGGGGRFDTWFLMSCWFLVFSMLLLALIDHRVYFVWVNWKMDKLIDILEEVVSSETSMIEPFHCLLEYSQCIFIQPTRTSVLSFKCYKTLIYCHVESTRFSLLWCLSQHLFVEILFPDIEKSVDPPFPHPHLWFFWMHVIMTCHLKKNVIVTCYFLFSHRVTSKA